MPTPSPMPGIDLTDRSIVVAVDVGNTSIEAVSQDGERFHHRLSRWSLEDGDHDAVRRARQSAAEDFRRWLMRWVATDFPSKIEVHLASVDDVATNCIAAAIDKTVSTMAVIQAKDVGIDIDVDDAAAVGIDRLIAASAAADEFGDDVVVIDSGSAITVDLVRARTFRGGVILPGLTMQAKALASGTQKLSEVEFDREVPAIPARNTHDCIVAGVMRMTAAGIDAIVEQYLTSRLSGHPRDAVAVVGTGGDIEHLRPLLRTPLRTRESLVCRGLLRMATAT